MTLYLYNVIGAYNVLDFVIKNRRFGINSFYGYVYDVNCNITDRYTKL